MEEYVEYEDYLTPFAKNDKFYLPDGKQYIEFRVMNEGDRLRYQQKTNRPINFNNKDNTATLRPDLGGDRHELIKVSVIDWFIVRKTDDGYQPVQFNTAQLNNWLQAANPKLIDDLAFAIRKANPWMQDEMEEQEIVDEIDRLQQLLDQKRQAEAEKN